MTAIGETAHTWQLGTSPATYVISNVRVVLGDRVTDPASVAVTDGRIAEVVEGPSLRGDVDGGGLLLTPGFIDTHSDALEKERTPRPSVHLPLDFAIGSFESRVAGVGITTIFHGLGFHNNSSHGVRRDPVQSNSMSSFIDGYRGSRVDHRVLHRFNVRAEEGAEVLRQRIESLPPSRLPVQLSHEDHTPGQGQYADVERHIDFLVSGGADRADATRRVYERIEDAKRTEQVREANLAWAGELARTGTARLLGHDCDSPEAIDELVERGGVVAEFPTTIEAARRARERGLLIVAGAPNLLRGGSHSGNVSAADLLREGLIDAVSSDYLASALLGCVSRVVNLRLLTLPAAIKLITAGGAAVGGLPDRGRIDQGLLADFALIDDRGTWPSVVTTFKSVA
ncbi:alpha-D-ribose 1-methylphosphonate 5-triphosphate diphosphatase [Actinopolymorpha pittospori]|uniref:Alpha-D-ribose 1-methylphosphonate 5-triphosphate diphosphatase n=1 Tax=Actinopolymorpha pittospori TaxID=648752 RepID=A0A927MU68_9ACTN|nr:alpha-D-ribose 1-methylphosphonate 5-triphosphate diphosphatase [Actinopolymorpha pittospori]